MLSSVGVHVSSLFVAPYHAWIREQRARGFIEASKG